MVVKKGSLKTKSGLAWWRILFYRFAGIGQKKGLNALAHFVFVLLIRAYLKMKKASQIARLFQVL